MADVADVPRNRRRPKFTVDELEVLVDQMQRNKSTLLGKLSDVRRPDQERCMAGDSSYDYSSTCHERTPSGPGKNVRTLQVAARHRDGRAGGGRQI